MKELLTVVLDYLKTEKVDYAILIKGPWGCGKTHFFKNSLLPEIIKHALKPIYISLYGISRTEDIAKKIFLGINPKLGSGTGQKLSEIAKVAATAFNVDTGKFKANTWLKVKKDFVLCFDDLERAKLDVEEVLGYINSFVEHDHLRTIIIANEDEIVEREREDSLEGKKEEASPQAATVRKTSYQRIKEKLIGITFEHKPEIESVLSKIIDTDVTENDLKDFLKQHKSLILEILRNSGSQNIRILKHAIFAFRPLYLHLNTKHRAIMQDFAIKILILVLSISFEVKSGEIGNENISKLKRIRFTEAFFIFLHKPLLKEKGDSYLQSFYDKYYASRPKEFYYNGIILDYILSGFFDVNAFDLEIEKKRKEEDEDPELKLIRSVWQGAYFTLTDEQFNNATREILLRADNGDIPLHMYLQTFAWLSFFSNEGLIPEKTDELVAIFNSGMENASRKTSYAQIKELGMPLNFDASKETKDIKEIGKAQEEHINKLKETDLRNKCTELFELLPERFDEFKKRYFDFHTNLAAVPIFKYCPVKDLFGKIIRLTNPELRDLVMIILERYKSEQKKFTEDYANLLLLNDSLREHLDGKKTKLSIHWLRELRKAIEAAIGALEKSLPKKS